MLQLRQFGAGVAEVAAVDRPSSAASLGWHQVVDAGTARSAPASPLRGDCTMGIGYEQQTPGLDRAGPAWIMWQAS